MKKIIMTILIGLMMAGIIGFASGASMKIYPSADAYVEDKHASTNYGVCSDGLTYCYDLRVGYNVNTGKDRSYVKFDLSSLADKNISSAVFSIHGVAPRLNPKVNLYLVSSNSWSESTITWNNKPAYSTLISSKLVTNTGRVNFTMPVSYLDASTLSMVLVEEGENADVKFYSKEYNDEPYRPYLQVEYELGDCNTAADANCDGTVSLIEYSTFKYNYKNGLMPQVTLTEYSTIKYNYKNGLLG